MSSKHAFLLPAALAVAAAAALAPAPAAPASAAAPVVTAPADGFDWAAARARTPAVEEARRFAELDGDLLVLAPTVEQRLESLRALVGGRPRALERLAFPRAPTAAERERLAAASAELAQVANEVREAVESAKRAVAAALARGAHRPDAAVLRERLAPLEPALAARAAEAAELAASASGALALRSGGFLARVRLWGRQLAGRDAPTALARLAELLRASRAPGPAVLAADLTYVHGALSAPALPTAIVRPAYLTGTSEARLEDTTQGREVEVGPEIVAKAAELGTAAAALDFVKNQTRLEWYFGSLQGSTQTLRTLRGNDADLAALLVALLRAQGTPARYVRGTIELPVARVAELMGLLGAAEVESLAAGAPLPAGAADRVLGALSAAGIPFEPVLRGGRAAAVRVLHTWVEAFVPWSEYRGATPGGGARAWVSMDPAVPGTTKYVARAPAVDAFAVSGGSSAALASDYLASGGAAAPLDFVRSRLLAVLPAGSPASEARRVVDLRPEGLPYVPGTLPFEVTGVHEELAFLPEEAKHRLRITVSGAGGTSLVATLPMHAVVGRRTVLAYKPASEVDAETIAVAGGLYAAPASAVALLPVLRVDGEERAVGTRAVGLGEANAWTLELLLPNGAVRRIANSVVAGNLVAIGLGAPANGYDEARDAGAPADGTAARFLYARAADYANAWTAAEEELAELLQVVPLRPTASVVLVENQLAVDEILGVRRRVVWKGLQVDADHRTMVPLELVAGRGKDLLRLSGLHGSFLEAHVLQAGTGEEAVAAVSVLQEAHRRELPVLSITPENAAAELARLATTPDVRREVEDQLARGRHVTIPAQDLTLRDWTGTGFIARDPITDEAGYFLAGIVSGGQTIVSPGAWSDSQLVAALQAPTAPRSTSDVSLVARIVKAGGDLQMGVVGEDLRAPLTVYVTTLSGVPVRGAKVKFRSVAPSRPMLHRVWDSLPPDETVTVETDESGRARAVVSPATDIRSHAVVSPGVPNEQLLGLNEITAETTSGSTTILLAQPFLAYGRPGPVAEVSLPCSLSSAPTCEREHVMGIDLGVPLVARLLDRHGNWIPNQPVAWAGELVAGRFVDVMATERDGPFVLGEDEAQAPSLLQVSRTDGTAAVAYIPPVVPDLELSRTFQVAAFAGAVRSDYAFRLRSSPACVLRLAANVDRSFDGLHGTAFSTPVGAQILRWTPGAASPWTPTAAAGGGIERAWVSMVVTDLSAPTPRQLRVEEQSPGGAESPRPGLDGYYGPTTATFWPRYEVHDGRQRNSFFGWLRADGATHACGSGWVIEATSGRPTIATRRVLPGHRVQPTDAYGYASASDLGVQFEVTNPAGYDIYAKVVEWPRVAGDRVVLVPDPASGFIPRHPDDPTLFKVYAGTATTFPLGLAPGTRGGDVVLEIHAYDPVTRITFDTTHRGRIRVAPPGTGILSETDELRARIVIPVPNFESTRTPEPGRLSPAAPTVEPLLFSARLEFRVKGSGRVEVKLGATTLAAAHVVANEAGEVESSTPSGQIPEPIVTPTGALAVLVPPADPTVREVSVTFDDGTEVERRVVPFRTDVDSAGSQPVGHTFVRDVDVASGHVAKSFVDLAVAGRGPALTLSRSYFSRGAEASPLGEGWSHGYLSYVVKDGAAAKRRYMVVGGEGTGQTYTCSGAPEVCAPQPGYHGRLTATESEVRYTARSGTLYRYGRSVFTGAQQRFYLTSIVDAVGREVELSYLDEGSSTHVQAVYESGKRRLLWFTYSSPPGASHPQLDRVALMRNHRARAVESEEDAAALTPLACVEYGFDALQNLMSASLYEGGCGSGPAARTEGYAYAASLDPAIRNNLTSYTDPNGNVTRYEYYGVGDALPGESLFALFGDKVERVKRVIDPPTATGSVPAFTFVYSLVAQPIAVAGEVVQSFETKVLGPRPGQETRYQLDGYGSAGAVTRKLGVVDGRERFATARTRWDPVHRRPVVEEDARGRRTRIFYDGRGNLVERRVETPVLGDPNGAADTEPLVDAAGAPVAATIERWSHHPDFGGETCRIDAEGRLTTSSYDARGLLVSRTRAARPLPAERVRSADGSSCDDLAHLAQWSEEDVVTQSIHCGEPTCSAAAGAIDGDLLSTTEGTRITRVASYDALGHPEETHQVVRGALVKRWTTFDDRGRPTRIADSLGRETVTTWNALDRPVFLNRLNGKGAGAPPHAGEHRSFEYYPGGQLQKEKLWAERVGPHEPDEARAVLVRAFTLDGRGRPAVVTESGAGLAASLSSTMRYDEAGNPWQSVDRRGVVTTTIFDLADRPVEVRKDLPLLPPEQGHRVAAKYEYDSAGNRIAETDVHGHRTDFRLDPLYRTVRAITPEVPGTSFDVAGLTRYETARRFDLVGNAVLETDGNLNTTRRAYDHADRLVRTEDALGRVETRVYDVDGNLEVEERRAGDVSHLRRTTDHDELGRPLLVTEVVRVVDPGAPRTAGWTTYTSSFEYDDAAHTVAARDRRGFVTVRELDDLDRVFRETVDAAHELRSPDDPRAGRALELLTLAEYDAAGNRSAVVDPEGRRTEETFDALGRLVERRLPMGVREAFRHDGEGNLVWHRDRRGVERKFTFDVLSRPLADTLVESLSGGGAALTMLRREYRDVPDASGRVEVRSYDARGWETVRAYDALHREVAVTDAAGHTVATRWDAAYRRAVEDRRGYRTTLDYDRVGRLTWQREFDRGGVERYYQRTFHDDAEGSERHLDRRGLATVSYRDGLGRVAGSERLAGNTTQPLAAEFRVHDANGNVVRAIDPNGHVVETVFDGANRRIVETRAAGAAAAATTAYRYDRVGNLRETKGPRGTWEYDERVSYDDLDRPVRTEQPTGDPAWPLAVTTRAFDGAGNKVCEKRPLGGDPLGEPGARGLDLAQVEARACGGEHVTRYGYDELSKLVSVVDAGGGEHSFVYDAARNLVAKQDANGNLTTYGYDATSRRTDEWQHLDAHGRIRGRSEVPDGAAEGPADPANERGALHWQTRYDDSGNVKERTDPRGFTVSVHHGILDRLEEETYPEPTFQVAYPYPLSVTYGYDGNGNVELVTELKRTGPGTSVEEVKDPAYDGQDRLESEQRYDGKVITYGYDAKGNRTRVTDPDGVSTTYGYDGQDRLETVTTPAGVTGYRYWPDGLLKGTTHPNGLEEGRCYDAAGRVTAIVTGRGAIGETCESPVGLVSLHEYGYDANGNRTVQRERRTDPGTQALGAVEETRYGYDELDRLVGVSYPEGTAELYRLDGVGNRTGERRAMASRVTALTVAAFAALAPGDALADVTRTYNRADWLISQEDAKDAGRSATYGWDLAGNLTRKVSGTGDRTYRWTSRNTLAAVVESGVEVGAYDYDADGQRVKRRTGTEQVEYVLDDRHVLQEASGEEGHPAYRRYHYGNGPLAVVDGAGSRSITTDALGSPTDLTGAGGTVSSARKYDAWGRYRGETAPGPSEPKLGYTGHQYDPESGLVYARARYYDPEMGRFLSRDPVEVPPEGAPYLHRFVYAGNSPAVYTDPSGEILPFLAFVALAAVIGGEASFIAQEIENQATSVSAAVERTDWGRVAKTAGISAATAAVGYGGALAGAGVGGVAARAGATALNLGELGTAALTGGGAAFGAGVAGDLAVQATEKVLGQRDEISVTRSLVVGAVFAPFGAGAGVLKQVGASFAQAAATGLQQGAAEVAGARAATPELAKVAASTEFVQVVEAAARPGTARAPAVPPGGGGQGDSALALERERLVRLLHKRELGLDPAHGGRSSSSADESFKWREAEQGYSLEGTQGRLRRDPSGGAEWLGRRGSYDAIGPFPAQHFNGPEDLGKAVAFAIRGHLPKADIVPVDLTGLGPAELRAVEAEIAKLPQALQARLIRLR